MLIRLPILLMLVAVMSLQAWSQTAGLPTRTACKQWDDAYLEFFNAFFWVMLIGSCALSLFLPPLIGRFAWWAASPRLRILWIALGVSMFGILIVIVFPQAIGFGWLLYSGIGEQYPECAKVAQFGAEGLLYGMMGANVAAIALWPNMVLLFLVAALIGGAMAFFLSESSLRRLGLYARVKGGE